MPLKIQRLVPRLTCPYSCGMTALTRRRGDNPHEEIWQIYFTDVRIGTIGVRAGVACARRSMGLVDRLLSRHGARHMAEWHSRHLRSRARGFRGRMVRATADHPDAAFAEWRQDRDWQAEVAAKRARGEKLDSEIRSTLMRCVCGTTFDSWKPAESYQHRAHITAAQAANGTRR